MPKKQPPVPVRVARWSALAACVTALASTVNTMWETKPWFLGGEETKEVRVENVQPMVSMYVADGGLDLSDTTEPAAVEEFQSVEVAAPAAPATIFDRISYFKYDHPIYFWLIVSCVGTLVGYALIEYFYRNRGEQ